MLQQVEPRNSTSEKLERSIVCTIFICAQKYVQSIREMRDVKRLYHNFEILFIRLYFNRYPMLQWTLERIYERPLFSYSYLMFRLRYLIAGPPFGLDWNYRNEEWQTIKRHFRKMRRVKEALLAGLFILLVAYAEWCFLIT